MEIGVMMIIKLLMFWSNNNSILRIKVRKVKRIRIRIKIVGLYRSRLIKVLLDVIIKGYSSMRSKAKRKVDWHS